MRVRLGFNNFIGHMRTPELVEKIQIYTKCRSSYKTSPDKVLEAINKFLSANGLPSDHYQKLCDTVAAQDLNWKYAKGPDGKQGCIVVPGSRLLKMMVQASRELGKRTGIDKALLYQYVYISDFLTDRKINDWSWRRMMPLRDKSGKSLTSNPDIQTNQVIGICPRAVMEDTEAKCIVQGKPEKFYCEGEIDLDPLAPQDFDKSFWWQFDYASLNVGVGCSRTMGFGRFLREGGVRIQSKAKIIADDDDEDDEDDGAEVEALKKNHKK